MNDRVQRQVDRLLTEAEDAMANGDWETVRLRSEAALRLRPGETTALAYMAAAGTELVPHERANATSPDETAERRVMAVMFCDLRGSTELAEAMDPEDLRDVLRAYHTTAAAVVERFDGYIARYMGDGLLVYFGYPRAHEDDADRAVRAGLEIAAAAEELPPYPDGEIPRVRVGIHYGLAVIAEMGGGSRIEPNDVVGETANVAARIQSLAAPSTVVISDRLNSALRHPYVLAGLGSHQLKGITRPIELFRVDGLESPNEPDVTSSGPLVGRATELRVLQRALDRAANGYGKVLLVVGEAGMGKTRLVAELRRNARDADHAVIQLAASSFHRNTALRPVIEHLSRRLGLHEHSDSMEPLSRLHHFLAALELDRPELVRPLAMLLNIPNGLSETASALTGEDLKEAMFAALTEWIRAVARRTPTLLVVEDLHWLDPSSVELLQRIAHEAPDARMLILVTSRPDPRPTALEGGEVEQLSLGKLEPNSALELVVELAGNRGLSRSDLELLTNRSGGVPLFAEELVRAALLDIAITDQSPERTPPGESDVPPALFSTLMERLDRMGPAREVARIAAACGGDVPVPLIAHVAGTTESEARDALVRLSEAGICVPIPQSETYAFKHALIQEVAYESMLRAHRASLHGAIASAIESDFPSIRDQEPEILAHHYERAGLARNAITYLRLAASQALARSANKEAVTHLSRALNLLEPEPQSAPLELELRNEVGPPLIAIAGYSSPEVEANYARAIEVSRLLTDPGQSFRALLGLRRFHQVKGDVARALSISTELVGLADSIGEPVLRGIAHRAMGEALFLGAEPREARRELESALSMLDTCRVDGVEEAKEPSVTVRSYLALTYWCLGYPNMAAAAAAEAVVTANTIDSKFGKAYALVLSAWIHELRREPEKAFAHAKEASAVAEEHHFPYWAYGATVYRGWARSTLGIPDGIPEFVRGLDGFRAIGARTTEAHLLALLAEMKGMHEGAREALHCVEQGLQAAHQSGEVIWLAELHRLRAQFTLASRPDHADQAWADFEDAVRQARSIGAHSFELRAAVTFAASSAAAGQAAGRGLKALRSALRAFPEASGSPELDAAQVLLARLEGSLRGTRGT